MGSTSFARKLTLCLGHFYGMRSKKVAQNKLIFPNDQDLIKRVYLDVEEAAKE